MDEGGESNLREVPIRSEDIHARVSGPWLSGSLYSVHTKQPHFLFAVIAVGLPPSRKPVSQAEVFNGFGVLHLEQILVSILNS
jgi:hypothetical protein